MIKFSEVLLKQIPGWKEGHQILQSSYLCRVAFKVKITALKLTINMYGITAFNVINSHYNTNLDLLSFVHTGRMPPSVFRASMMWLDWQVYAKSGLLLCKLSWFK